MHSFTFYFAHMKDHPCNSSEDLPKHTDNPAVKVIKCENEDRQKAYDFLVKKARNRGFTWLNHMSYFEITSN